jgi:hypothetical protein
MKRRDEEVGGSDSLGELLRQLPRERSSLGFTERVLRRLDAEPAARRQSAWLLAVAAVVAGLLLSFGLTAYQRSVAQQERVAARQRVDRLRSEYEDITRQLDELRRLATAAEPVLTVDGPADVDYVFDLRDLSMRAAAGSVPARAVPARFSDQPIRMPSKE